MNKKFSTLMASLLLAGAFVGTANAIDVTGAKPGQYYRLMQQGYYNGTWGKDASQMPLVDNGTVFAQYRGTTALTNKSDYWTIQVRTNASGDKEARFVNVNTGRALKLGGSEWFKASYLGTHSTLTENLLYLGGTATQLAVEQPTASSDYWELTMKGAGACTGSPYYAIGFDAVAVPATQYTAAGLNALLGSSFGLRIGFMNNDEEFEDYALQGAEAFQGNLVAKTEALVSGATTGIAAPTTGNNVHIWNAAAKKYVVLTKNAWGSLIDADGSTSAPKGYKFALMSAAEIKADLDKPASKQTILTATFNITGEANKDGRLEVVALKYDGTNDAELYVYKNDGKYYLTVNKASAAGTADDEATYMTSTWVKFGVANNINVSDFYGYAVTIKGVKGNEKGKTLDPQGFGSGWINTEYVGMTKPEGQWIVTTDATGNVTWTNRETGATTTEFSGMRLVEGNIYTTGAIGGVDQLYEITKTDKLGGDTYEYYGEYEANDHVYGEPHNYKIAFKNATSGVVEYVSINGKGELILTNNKSAAIVFDLWKTWMTNDMNANGTVKADALVDRFHIVNDAMLKNKKGEWEYVTNADTVSFYRYNFVYDGKYLAYNGNDRLTLSSTAADAFVIKEKDGDAVNIINVDGSDFDYIAGVQTYDPDAWVGGRDLLQGSWPAVSAPQMLFFDENKAILRQDWGIYNWNANAQLTIDDKDEIAYRKLAAPATMEFFRTEYSDEFLFEHGDFLGMTYNREKYNPAIYVDTAYVRGETKKPLYMLAVGVNKTEATTYCPVHGVGATCEHAEEVPGLISARYLVSLTDSVAKYDALLNNPFCYTGTKLEKLGFVPATHVVDTVYIPTVGEKSNKWFINGTGLSPVTFAFRIVNAETEDFVIETAKLNAARNAYNVAYVKWHNGCPVLTNDIREAEVFNVRATEAEATANEAIAAEGVQVIAGKGVVTVQGAAGKVITVANILGQTIANQVAASDNVTIAAPAGVVVVAVDGEATKVVVK